MKRRAEVVQAQGSKRRHATLIADDETSRHDMMKGPTFQRFRTQRQCMHLHTLGTKNEVSESQLTRVLIECCGLILLLWQAATLNVHQGETRWFEIKCSRPTRRLGSHCPIMKAGFSVVHDVEARIATFPFCRCQESGQ